MHIARISLFGFYQPSIILTSSALSEGEISENVCLSAFALPRADFLFLFTARSNVG